MPDLGFYHPIVVHFAIGLLAGGVGLRVLSLARRGRPVAPAAVALVLAAAVAIVLAARSGEDAHVAVEAAPGVGPIVRGHETWGERTRAAAVVAAGLELATLALRRRPLARAAALASAAVGVAALACVVETGKLGGELVYAHAGGVGIRSGEPGDVGRLLLAGLVRQADVDERTGRPREAVRLLRMAARRFPADADVQLRVADALLEDGHDPRGALAILERPASVAADPRLRLRRGWLTADALDALGRPDDARATLERLRAEFPADARLRRRLARADRGAATAE